MLLLLASAFAATPTLRVEVDAGTPLDVPALAAALGEELDTTVVLEGEAPARVVVRAEGAGTVTIVYESDDGARRERHVDLVAVGSRGLGTIDRVVMGSVSDEMARHTRAALVARGRR
ncbi:MAG: universal stress protein [Myxococcota bacterium]